MNKNTKEKRINIQNIMIDKYVDEECDNVNKLYPVMENGERDWGKLDEYNKIFEQHKKLASLIETEVLDECLKEDSKKVKRLKSKVASSIFKGAFFAGLTALIGYTSKGNVSAVDIIAMIVSSISAVKNIGECIVKSFKLIKLSRLNKKITHEWDILHTVPKYVSDFCKFNNIKVEEGPFGEFISDDFYLVRLYNDDIKVTTEERANSEGLHKGMQKCLISVDNEQRG